MANDTFGEAVYEAWRRGLNSDLVDGDFIAYYESQGYEPEECVALELRRITSRKIEESGEVG